MFACRTICSPTRVSPRGNAGSGLKQSTVHLGGVRTAGFSPRQRGERIETRSWMLCISKPYRFSPRQRGERIETSYPLRSKRQRARFSPRQRGERIETSYSGCRYRWSHVSPRGNAGSGLKRARFSQAPHGQRVSPRGNAGSGLKLFGIFNATLQGDRFSPRQRGERIET